MAVGLALGQVTSQSNPRSPMCMTRSVSEPQTHPGHLPFHPSLKLFLLGIPVQVQSTPWWFQGRLDLCWQLQVVLGWEGIRWGVPRPLPFVCLYSTPLTPS